MKPKGSLHSELGGLASASSFPHMLLAVFVATAVGAASGAAVVLSLETPNPETPVVMRTTKTIDPPEAANSRIRPEALTTSQRPLSYRSAIARIDRAEASGIADQDASSNSSRSEPPRADTSGGNDGPTWYRGKRQTLERSLQPPPSLNLNTPPENNNSWSTAGELTLRALQVDS